MNPTSETAKTAEIERLIAQADGEQVAGRWPEAEALFRQVLALRPEVAEVFNNLGNVLRNPVVDDLEGQSRRLIDFCGLEWDDRCLSFHQTSRPISTASNAQVRRPLYRTSVARWRRYEAFLEPLLTELGPCRPAT